MTATVRGAALREIECVEGFIRRLFDVALLAIERSNEQAAHNRDVLAHALALGKVVLPG